MHSSLLSMLISGSSSKTVKYRIRSSGLVGHILWKIQLIPTTSKQIRIKKRHVAIHIT